MIRTPDKPNDDLLLEGAEKEGMFICFEFFSWGGAIRMRFCIVINIGSTGAIYVHDAGTAVQKWVVRIVERM